MDDEAYKLYESKIHVNSSTKLKLKCKYTILKFLHDISGMISFKCTL